MPATAYYADKISSLSELFGSDVSLSGGAISVRGICYPIVDDVIILLPYERCPDAVKVALDRRRSGADSRTDEGGEFARDIQNSFGAEWREYPTILPEHRQEFSAYFDLIDVSALRNSRVGDLGCGSGRWSHFLAPHCREIVLVDFSESIFVSRENLRPSRHAIFFMGDLTALPFQADCFDFAFCLGVLHHLPVSALQAVRKLAPLAPTWLIYLYYSLDHRPFHERALLAGVTVVRKVLSNIESAWLRRRIAKLLAICVPWPAIGPVHTA